jgi:predicted negative regulator of RcsB-dependent stress response
VFESPQGHCAQKRDAVRAFNLYFKSQMPTTEERPQPKTLDDRTESITEWLHVNSKLVGIAVGVVAAVALGGWLYTRAQAGKEIRAEQTLRRAEQSVAAGNAPLAQTDLEKLASGYRGTSGASQGAMLLAQLHMEKAEYQKAIDVLQNNQAGRKDFEAPVEAMIADAYSQLNKPADAAAHYRKAAEATRFQAERDGYLADAARHLVAANDTAGARQIWQSIASNPKSEFAPEAHLRLGELTATAAKNGA